MSNPLILFITLVVLNFSFATVAEDDGVDFQEKCYCIARAGYNDGGPEGPGGSTKNFDCNDWKYVSKGSCVEVGGSLTPGLPAK